MGNIKVSYENDNDLGTNKNAIYTKECDSLENVTYDVFENQPTGNRQHKSKDELRPALPFKPPHLTKVPSRCAKNEGKVDIASSYNRLEELSRKCVITSKDVQETLRIVKDLENLFHDKVNVILSKFEED
nr:unnamed protein product [Callosobruchus analis]